MRNKYLGIAVLTVFALGALMLSPFSCVVSWRLSRRIRKEREKNGWE